MQAVDFIEHGLYRPAALRAARHGDDAERAAVAAAVLDLDECPLPAAVEQGDFPGFGRHGRHAGGIQFRQREADQSVLVPVADHQVDAHGFRRLLRIQCRITAADDQLGRRVVPVDAADQLPGFAHRFLGDRAGVDHDQVGILLLPGDPASCLLKALRPVLQFRLVEAAAQCLEMYLHDYPKNQ